MAGRSMLTCVCWSWLYLDVLGPSEPMRLLSECCNSCFLYSTIGMPFAYHCDVVGHCGHRAAGTRTCAQGNRDVHLLLYANMDELASHALSVPPSMSAHRLVKQGSFLY
jgi:hypothetical protein